MLYHSEAIFAIVTITETDKEFPFVITDDGNGFDVIRLQHSNGLTIIKKRAASINADVVVASKPGKGTEVSVRLRK